MEQLIMPDPMLTLIAAANPDPANDALRRVPGAIEGDITKLEAVPHDIAQLPLFEHLSQVMPAADLVLGGGMLLLIMLVHATGVRSVTNHVLRRSTLILARPTTWRADLLMSGTVFGLLSLHVLEIVVWAAGLVYSGLVHDWRAAGFFAGNTYTTVGYGNFILPTGWHMLAPIIAISGLFTFGWSGSVLVDLVGRCQKIKDAAGAT
jgi:hypothetical protein